MQASGELGWGGGVCDYWGSTQHASQSTLVLITWDDWGGWYDDVVPPNCGPGDPCGYLNSGTPPEGAQYVYGFRVPLLVVSAYTKQTSAFAPEGFTGYVDGPSNPADYSCPNPYCHDFGSILNFVEYAFGVRGTYGIAGDSSWPYADYFAMDYDPSNPDSYPLADFFNFTADPQSFQAIGNVDYGQQCFHAPNTTGCFPGSYPQDPDDDAEEQLD
jgi:Phosphoesterase family